MTSSEQIFKFSEGAGLITEERTFQAERAAAQRPSGRRELRAFEMSRQARVWIGVSEGDFRRMSDHTGPLDSALSMAGNTQWVLSRAEAMVCFS